MYSRRLPLRLTVMGRNAARIVKLAIMVENNETAMETLREKGFTIITEGDLEDDPTVNQ